jgi:hypothetical protein
MIFQPASENLTHVSKEFLTDDELDLLTTSKEILRVEPISSGGGRMLKAVITLQ